MEDVQFVDGLVKCIHAQKKVIFHDPRNMIQEETSLEDVEKNVVLFFNITKNKASHPIQPLLPNEHDFILISSVNKRIIKFLKCTNDKNLDLQEFWELLSKKTSSSINIDESQHLSHYQNISNNLPPIIKCCINNDVLCELSESQARTYLYYASKHRDSINQQLDKPLPMVIVPFNGGYLGQRFHEKGYTIARIEKLSQIEGSFPLLEDLINNMEVSSGTRNPKNKMQASVTAKYCLWSGTSSQDPSFVDEIEYVQLISSWSGIENISKVLCPPPPSCSSLLYFLDIHQIQPSVININLTSYPNKLHQAILQLKTLQIVVDNHEYLNDFNCENNEGEKWRKRIMSMYNEDREHNEADVTLDISSADLQSGTSENIRSDLDFLEKFWDHLVVAPSPNMIVLAVKDMISSFSRGIFLPFLHKTNRTALCIHMKEGLRLLQQKRNMQNSTDSFSKEFEDWNKKSINALKSHNVVKCILELGVWKVFRDIKHWLSQYGISFNALDPTTSSSSSMSLEYLKRLQNIVHVISLAISCGLNHQAISRLASQSIQFYEENKSDSSPILMVTMDTSLTQQVRETISHPLSWNLTLSRDDSFYQTTHFTHKNNLQCLSQPKDTFDDLYDSLEIKEGYTNENLSKIVLETLKHDRTRQMNTRSIYQITCRNIEIP